MVKDDAYPKPGETTRVLGYPIGNDFSVLAWFRAKYRGAPWKDVLDHWLAGRISHP